VAKDNSRFSDPRYIDWALKVKKRDDYTCIICNIRGEELNSHHMNSWDIYVSERFDVDNGVTLCASCHQYFHKIYGFQKNTKYQFTEFKKLAKIIIKQAKNKNES